MCCANFLLRHFLSSHLYPHLMAQYGGASSCTVRVRDTMSVYGATMRGVLMHLCHPRDEKNVFQCVRDIYYFTIRVPCLHVFLEDEIRASSQSIL